MTKYPRYMMSDFTPQVTLVCRRVGSFCGRVLAPGLPAKRIQIKPSENAPWQLAGQVCAGQCGRMATVAELVAASIEDNDRRQEKERNEGKGGGKGTS